MCIAGCSSSGGGGTEHCFLGTAQASGRNRSGLACMISRPLLNIILGLGLQPCKCVLQVAVVVVPLKCLAGTDQIAMSHICAQILLCILCITTLVLLLQGGAWFSLLTLVVGIFK